MKTHSAMNSSPNTLMAVCSESKLLVRILSSLIIIITFICAYLIFVAGISSGVGVKKSTEGNFFTINAKRIPDSVPFYTVVLIALILVALVMIPLLMLPALVLLKSAHCY